MSKCVLFANIALCPDDSKIFILTFKLQKSATTAGRSDKLLAFQLSGNLFSFLRTHGMWCITGEEKVLVYLTEPHLKKSEVLLEPNKMLLHILDSEKRSHFIRITATCSSVIIRYVLWLEAVFHPDQVLPAPLLCW
ncbi:hypothetical protein ILYODFUR_012968 [Ilyodon furcidens]|uniref:Uncharacterized protein n=1 Tax=Ilyodon furcidens TaxID=33524 RepID=A0ABV0UHH3_9TELE